MSGELRERLVGNKGAVRADGLEPDVRVSGEGPYSSVYRVELLTDRAKNWVAENVDTESWQWLGSALVVEHRFVDTLLGGMVDADLLVTV